MCAPIAAAFGNGRPAASSLSMKASTLASPLRSFDGGGAVGVVVRVCHLPSPSVWFAVVRRELEQSLPELGVSCEQLLNPHRLVACGAGPSVQVEGAVRHLGGQPHRQVVEQGRCLEPQGVRADSGVDLDLR